MADEPVGKAQWTPIDLNRGVTLRQDKESGAQVYMYKDTPGYYFSQFGKPLPIAMAEKVGFPVELHKKERLRNERRAFATKEIDKELEMADKAKPQVLQSRGEFRIMDRGIGRADVTDVDGNVYNPQPLPLAAAERLLTAMAGAAVPLNPQEVLVARKKHDAIERVREGYDKDIDVEGVSEVVGGKEEPSVWRGGHEVDPVVQKAEPKTVLPGASQAEISEKARLKADDPNAPNAQPIGTKVVSKEVFPVKTYDDPDVYQGGNIPDSTTPPLPPKYQGGNIVDASTPPPIVKAKVRSLG